MLKVISILLFSISLTYAYQPITAELLSDWIEGNAPFEFIVIDVREINEVTSIIGSGSCSAYNFPLTGGDFENAMDMFPLDTVIVLYCASGHRSSQAAQLLDSNGFTKIYSLTGGMNSWNGPTLPASGEKPADLFPATFCSNETSIRPLSTGNKISTRKLSVFRGIYDLRGRSRKAIAPGILLTGDNSTRLYLRSSVQNKVGIDKP